MIFLTGSTGFLGRELSSRLLAAGEDARLGLLARGADQKDAEERVRASLVETMGRDAYENAAERIEVVQGDIREERFGLEKMRFESLAKRSTAVFHCAATTKLDLPLEAARQINVGGTEQVLSFSQIAQDQHPEFRFHHISTAYVAGKKQRVVTADELCFRDGFRNTYEQSKAESEALVRRSQVRLRATIYRPSVIVGDSITGRTSAFNVIYLPAKMLIKGICKALPAMPHTPFDVVPIDYVANAILHLSNHPAAVGSCYHLSAGLGRESTPVEVIDSLLRAFDKHRIRRPKHLRAPLLVAPELISRAFGSFSAAAQGMKQLEKKVTEHIHVFSQLLPLVPYMLSNPQFDATETFRDLKRVMDPPPLFPQYADTVFRYCFETNWGRRPLPAA